ncbi:hypothetical protein HGRIS_008604 [Hohenbuehelia grisea]|uniref:DUF6699 domain-containing protein n=1 Tax=Hohenbuehelia grisea TaxID=104357 RepID=A0ABR3J910_9AGAR
MVINDFLLGCCPDFDVAVTHDDEWARVVSGKGELPEDKDLIIKFIQLYQIRLRSDGISPILRGTSSGSDAFLDLLDSESLRSLPSNGCWTCQIRSVECELKDQEADECLPCRKYGIICLMSDEIRSGHSRTPSDRDLMKSQGSKKVRFKLSDDPDQGPGRSWQLGKPPMKDEKPKISLSDQAVQHAVDMLKDLKLRNSYQKQGSIERTPSPTIVLPAYTEPFVPDSSSQPVHMPKPQPPRATSSALPVQSRFGSSSDIFQGHISHISPISFSPPSATYSSSSLTTSPSSASLSRYSPLSRQPVHDIFMPSNFKNATGLEWRVIDAGILRDKAMEPFLVHPATLPPVSAICIVTQGLPWIITVRASLDGGAVTCSDIIRSISDDLMKLVGRAEYEAQTEDTRKALQTSYHRLRSTSSEKTVGIGLRRLDYLGMSLVFDGFQVLTV